jgi:hypothetical protein
MLRKSNPLYCHSLILLVYCLQEADVREEAATRKSAETHAHALLANLREHEETWLCLYDERPSVSRFLLAVPFAPVAFEATTRMDARRTLHEQSNHTVSKCYRMARGLKVRRKAG